MASATASQPAAAAAASAADPKLQRRLKDVKHIILVLSGKGGVGAWAAADGGAQCVGWRKEASG